MTVSRPPSGATFVPSGCIQVPCGCYFGAIWMLFGRSEPPEWLQQFRGPAAQAHLDPCVFCLLGSPKSRRPPTRFIIWSPTRDPPGRRAPQGPGRGVAPPTEGQRHPRRHGRPAAREGGSRGHFPDTPFPERNFTDTSLILFCVSRFCWTPRRHFFDMRVPGPAQPDTFLTLWFRARFRLTLV